MARQAKLSAPAEENAEEDEISSDTGPTRRRQRRVSNVASLSPSPAASFSSDKENRASSARANNGKAKAMPPPKLPTPPSIEPATPRASKRRKLSERDVPNASQVAHQKQLEEIEDIEHYDPNQSMEERRGIRKEIRDLSRELNDSRAEYLASGSDGLIKTLNKANDIFTSVKQTSDATLDSRLLVSTADLSAKRTTQLNLGDATQGIDVDDFVGKCITFMRRAPSSGDPAASRRARRRDESDEDHSDADVDEGDAFNWDWLGRQACFPSNVRPPVPGFLLGPLSVQKRLRKQTQHRERLQKRNPKDAVHPEELKAKDLERVENSNLTTLCKNIRDLLVHQMVEGPNRVEQEVDDDMTEEQIRALMMKHGVADDAGIPLFHFVINPHSFGQTVENLFYVSFLIRDGTAAIGNDSSMLPTLHATKPRGAKEIKEEGISKHQAVFHLDFQTWEDLIEAFDIKESIIPHRQSTEETQVSASGWYG